MNKYDVEDIRQAFIPDDRTNWVDPKLSAIQWDDLDFLAWKHPKAGNYFACVEEGGRLFGFIFSMNTGTGNTGTNCDLCFASNDEVGVKAAMVETVDNPKKKIGIHVCSDLACSHRVRGLQRGVFLYETISTGRRIERLQQKMVRFVTKVYCGKLTG